MSSRPNPALLRLGERKGVIRALKKGFGFIRMQTLEGEPTPSDIYFDYAEQDAARIKRVQPGAKVFFNLNFGPKRMLRAYGVALDEVRAHGDSRNVPAALALQKLGLPEGFKGREPKKLMGPFAWGQESINAWQKKKEKRRALSRIYYKTHDSEGFPLASASNSATPPPHLPLTKEQVSAERLRRRAAQRAARRASVLLPAAGVGSATEGGSEGGGGGVAAAAAAAAAASGDGSGLGGGSGTPLPEGWERRVDASGAEFNRNI
jgi:cold shock CspA family protein